MHFSAVLPIARDSSAGESATANRSASVVFATNDLPTDWTPRPLALLQNSLPLLFIHSPPLKLQTVKARSIFKLSSHPAEVVTEPLLVLTNREG